MDLLPSALPLVPALPDEVARLDARLGALGGDDSPERLAALLALVEALPVRDAERQGALASEAEALAGGLGDAVATARAVGLRGRALFFLSHNAEAVTVLTDAIERFSALGMITERLGARSMLAGVLASIGDYEEAISGALANLDDVRETGDGVAEGWVLVGLAGAYADLGDADRALEAAEGALALFTDLGVPMGVARAETGIGTALLLRDRPDAAEAHLTSALARFHDLDDPVGESRALNDLGTAARLRGDVEAGLVLHREALARRRGTSNRQAQSTSLLHIGEALVALGRPAEAVEALAEALSLAEGVGAGVLPPSALASAEAEARTLYAHLLVEGWLHEINYAVTEYQGDRTDAARPASERAFEQIAYDVRPAAVGLVRLHEATGDARYGVMAGLAAAWFAGDNPAGAVMADPASGRGYDGILAPDRINGNAGAESTVEAQMTLLEAGQDAAAAPWMHARGDAPRSGTAGGRALRYRVWTAAGTPGRRAVVVLDAAADTSSVYVGPDADAFLASLDP